MGAPLLALGEIGAFGHRLLDQRPDPAMLEQKSFRLHGLTLRVHSAAAEYLALCTRALIDDATNAAPRATLDITIIDRSATPRVPHAHLAGHTVQAEDLSKAFAAAGLDGILVGHGESWQVLDPVRGVGVETIAGLERMAPWERATPLCNFMHWGFQSVGMRLLHAGTLAHDGVGVLIVGAGGAGKSGTVLSGILTGLDSTGDDYVALSLSGEGVESFPVTRLMKQDAAGLRRLGIDPADGFGAVNWQGKYEFDFERFGRGRRAGRIRLAGIVLPQLAGAARSAFAPVSAREAAMATIPSNLQQLPGRRLESVRFAAEMARRLPAFRMTLSTDPEEIAASIHDLIGRLA